MNRKEWKWITVLLMACLAVGCKQVQTEDITRCITFYCNIKGVNSTILAVAQSLEEQLQTEDKIELSTYELSRELYGSLEYKADVAIALDMDVVILSGMKSADDREACQKLKDAGIPFVLVDGDNEQSGRYAYIGTDNFQAGRDAAKAVANLFETCNVGVISSPVQSGNTSNSRIQRREGFLSEAEEQDNISVVAECVCSSQLLEAMQTMRDFLDENPAIQVLFCTDSASGISAAKVIEERSLEEEMYVICFDMSVQIEEAIMNGGIDATLLQDTEKIGKACKQILKEIREGDDLEESQTITVDCTMITKDDLMNIE